MTVATPALTITAPLKRVELPEMDSGLRNASIGLGEAELEELPGYDAERNPAIGLAFESLVDEAIAEIAPKVHEMLYEAVERRLPWTYEPPADQQP